LEQRFWRWTSPDEPSATRAVHAFASLTGARTDSHGPSVTVSSTDASRLLIDAVHTLDSLNLMPQTLQVRAPTLDDAFLRLTGHAASSGQPSLNCGSAT
jgi:hypothetical protein